ncbi:MAG: aminotransferase class I/II-fold pyridoxal phosphate-dependent enzyme [Chitinophagales bacterium]|nr:aminotransferase class I/II-fold pyridoxal phosphate-dependent enzyme [Chitinophagales bacterium]MDW8418517.1 aminotransferase class I/II-fold pyridoxal phosphate-dependent enzyme [Chitinophagales bacterium]
MGLFDKCYNYNHADETKEKGIYPYFRPIQESEGPVVMMEGRKVVMAGSNNYLGLTTHPRVKQAAIAALEKYGASCSGSRFLTGTIDLHIELEEKIARFMGKEAALLFSTGFQAGQGVIFPLVSKGDYIFSDKDNHASIVAGNLLAASINVNVVRYKHNDMDDLARRLAQAPADANKFIVTDGVFSAHGLVGNIPGIVSLAKKYDAKILVDDAHGFGVMGPLGKGTVHHFGEEDNVDLIVCTFSKTLASLGGFVVGEERVINYLRHKSPALIFSASPTPASVAAASAALDILIENPDLPERVRKNADYVRKGLREGGFHVIDGEAAIVPVIIGSDEKCFQAWRMLYDEGVFVNAFISPATPPGMQMLRTSYMATHQREHLDFIIDKFLVVGKRLGLLHAHAG